MPDPGRRPSRRRARDPATVSPAAAAIRARGRHRSGCGPPADVDRRPRRRVSRAEAPRKETVRAMEGPQIDPADRWAIVQTRMAAYLDDANGQRLARSAGGASARDRLVTAGRGGVIPGPAANAGGRDELATLEAQR